MNDGTPTTLPRLSDLASYVLIAAAVLLLGTVINMMMGNGLGEDEFFGPGFWLLLGNYSILHMISASIVMLFRFFFSIRVRSGLYLAVSIFGFLVSLYVFNPYTVGGIHLFVGWWGSLVLIALVHFLRVRQYG